MSNPGTLLVTGAGSSLSSDTLFGVGLSSIGTATIADGASVSSRDAMVGGRNPILSGLSTHPAGSGAVLVTGAGSTWSTSEGLTIGDGGASTGAVTIADGASVSVGGNLDHTATGTLTLDGGSLRIGGAYNRHASGVLDYQSGTVQLGGDRTVGADSAISAFFGASPVIGADKHLVVEGSATLQDTLALAYGELTTDAGLHITGGGTLTGSGSIHGDVVNAGLIAPSNPDEATYPGWLDVYGSLTQTATGTLSLGLFGGIDYDMLFVENQLTLAGTLEIVSRDGFAPVLGDVFYLLNFGTLSGAFDHIDSFTLGAGLAWDFSQLYIDGSISVAAFTTPPVTSIFISGAVTPSPSTAPQSEWLVGHSLQVGFSGTGSLTIEAGGLVTNDAADIGYHAGDEGTVNVTGSGATWTNNGDLTVGYSGKGALAIADGGTVSSQDAYLGYNAGSEGHVTLTGAGSSLTADGLLFVGYEGDASLSIADGATVTSRSGYIAGVAGSRGAVTVTGAGSSWDAAGELNVGAGGEGTLLIADGGAVSNDVGYVGSYTGGSGVATVTGAGSTWTNRSALIVGAQGAGALTIADGGQVAAPIALIGDADGSEGHVTVTGAGSRLAIGGGGLVIARSGGSTGVLAVEQGGAVEVGGNLNINAGGTLAVDASGSSVTVGGNLRNDGLVRLTAASTLAAGTYTPLAVSGSFTGTGRYEAHGGVWDAASHNFIVAEAITAVSGETSTIDLTQTQRLIVTGTGGNTVSAAFNAEGQALGGGSIIDFTVTENTTTHIGGQRVAAGWDFHTDIDLGSGVVGGGSVFLEITGDAGLADFAIVPGSTVATIWHSEDGTNDWAIYGTTVVASAQTSTLITGHLGFSAVYSGSGEFSAQLRAPHFSSYAITFAPIPEPASVAALAGLGALGLAALRRRRRTG